MLELVVLEVHPFVNNNSTQFYVVTGLHAIHVIAGVVFLTVALIRVVRDSFTTEHHLG